MTELHCSLWNHSDEQYNVAQPVRLVSLLNKTLLEALQTLAWISGPRAIAGWSFSFATVVTLTDSIPLPANF